MDARFLISAEKRLIEYTFSGDVSFADIAQLVQSSTRHPTFDLSFNILADFREAEAAVNPGDLRNLLFQVSTLLPATGRKAAILIKSERTAGLAMLYAELSPSERNVRVFSTHEAAIAWFSEE